VIESLPELIVRYWMKTTFANIVRAILPRQSPRADYKRRLIGNLMAYRDLIFFRIDPRNILNISDSTGPPGRVQAGGAWRSEATRST
jgi:hypothetical protein